ncbi:DUF948 domain-containing protein [Neorhizobium sp. JUb45]|uniref:DUF948 domain-containing protein n=1 Tax=Neorhizobium sp. JUb45 TaxID=2485113 RepID=UPI00104F631D|nr:DUF948 domain-containing protein [Neorhizobium sp. JUb45]TCR07371.1 hypothetical protein EDF70_1011345 [Neorhizobium sp. JUb45]
MADKGKQQTTNWLNTAFIASGIYVAGFLMWIIPSAPSNFFSQPEPNEIGDFLAGLFAPVAFILLACAVVMQRQELKVTREELADNREVVAEQLKQIRTQTSMLADQQAKAEESARRTYKLNLYDKRYELYLDFIAFGEKHDSAHYMNDAYMEMLDLHQRSLFIFDKAVSDWFGEIADEIYNHEQYRNQETFIQTTASGIEVMKFRSEKAEKEINSTEAWLYDQFTLLEIRAEKFEPSMRVSDA